MLSFYVLVTSFVTPAHVQGLKTAQPFDIIRHIEAAIARLIAMPDTTAIGNVSEAHILLALIEAGYVVAKPFGDGCKYDFVIDDGRLLQRVQCKTGRLKNGCVVFNAFSVAGNSNGKTQSYLDLADLFAVYCPDNEQVYLMPVAQVGVSKVYLRIEKTQNRQQRRIRWANDHLLKPITSESENTRV